MLTFPAPTSSPTPSTQIPELLEATCWGVRGLNTGWGLADLVPPCSSLPRCRVCSRSLNLLSLCFHICTVSRWPTRPQDRCEELRCLPHPVPTSRGSVGSWGCGPSSLRFSPEAASGPRSLDFPR